MSFLQSMKQIAKSNKRTIVLPEMTDIRTIKATSIILEEGIANVILIGKKEDLPQGADLYDVSNAIFIDPLNYDKFDEMVDLLVDLRKAKGMTLEDATKILKESTLYFAVMLVKMGIAHGMVAGAINTTADVLRPSLQILKMGQGYKMVSSIMIMVVENSPFGANGIFAFGDCGLNQHPSADELAYIAVDTAKTFEALMPGNKAKVAMLSHSTKGSAKHADVDKVIEATKIAKERNPEFDIDGELQLDAAIVPKVGTQKAAGSNVAGQANVLIFPDLDAGNIGYKLVQRLAGAEAYGPITQGIAMPVNDLSRGCDAETIVGVVAITAAQAINDKNSTN